ncbi:MAG: nickel pincer cofactor biosynthesis protein LarC [Candidatus Zixiibacteriota bacterium]|nr:MAG: nickel pincer cofactor biosynthesis protein LarC [candidate division Zixibacteria bacterium]
MRIIYFDCYSGVSGDMILAALTDLGLDRDAWLQALRGLSVSGYDVAFSRTTRQGIAAQQVTVTVTESQPHRHLKHVEAIIRDSELPESVKEKSLAVFRLLAEAEARVHGTTVEKVHFHEVGAVDAIVDVTGACLALEMLGVEQVYSSPVGVGQGTAAGAHGHFPLPPPATLEILQGAPLRFSGVETELATPTGAALLKALARFEPPPDNLRLAGTGYGAGRKVIPQLPNVLRAVLLESSGAWEADRALLLETNIDDMNPEFYPHVIERLLEAGAMDAYLAPLIMKKGRPGVLLSALYGEDKAEAILDVIYRETSTLGLRIQRVERLKLPRRAIIVDTELGPVKGKAAEWQGRVRLTPEYEDCRRLAREKGVPLQDVYAAFHRAVK